jgi:hypothetical protein
MISIAYRQPSRIPLHLALQFNDATNMAYPVTLSGCMALRCFE